MPRNNIMDTDEMTTDDLLIKLIDETIILSIELGRLKRKIHSQYYDYLRRNYKLTNSIFVKEKRGKKAKVTEDEFYRGNEFEKDNIIFFD
jgi:hypothetical protein|tara:strand:+ start:494 stop:763 length:270 start_codon:yes stop_codon:yes gene_type:complete